MRERRVDVEASYGYRVALNLTMVGDDLVAPTVVDARVVSPVTGDTLATFDVTAAADSMRLELDAEQTLAVGTATARWFVVVDGRPWMGGRFSLAEPGVAPARSGDCAVIDPVVVTW